MFMMPLAGMLIPAKDPPPAEPGHGKSVPERSRQIGQRGDRKLAVPRVVVSSKTAVDVEGIMTR